MCGMSQMSLIEMELSIEVAEKCQAPTFDFTSHVQCQCSVQPSNEPPSGVEVYFKLPGRSSATTS